VQSKDTGSVNLIDDYRGDTPNAVQTGIPVVDYDRQLIPF
jgi:hypothetical protein